MSLLELLQHRRSVRVFDPEKPISQEDVRHCIEMATLAPQQLKHAALADDSPS